MSKLRKPYFCRPGDYIFNQQAFEAVKQQIELTSDSIDLCVYILTHKKLIEELKRKLTSSPHFKMRIIVDEFSISNDFNNANTQKLMDLANSGACIKVFKSDTGQSKSSKKIMHHKFRGLKPINNNTIFYPNKFCIFDGKIIMKGSLNWTTSAFKNNDENFEIFECSQTINEFNNIFNKIWNDRNLYRIHSDNIVDLTLHELPDVIEVEENILNKRKNKCMQKEYEDKLVNSDQSCIIYDLVDEYSQDEFLDTEAAEDMILVDSMSNNSIISDDEHFKDIENAINFDEKHEINQIIHDFNFGCKADFYETYSLKNYCYTLNIDKLRYSYSAPI